MGYQFDLVFDPELVTERSVVLDRLRLAGAVPGADPVPATAEALATLHLVVPHVPYTLYVYAHPEALPGRRADDRGHWARITIPWAHGNVRSLLESLLRFTDAARCGLYDRQHRQMVSDDNLFDVLHAFEEGADNDMARRVDLATEEAIPAQRVVEQDLALPDSETDVPKMHAVMPPSLVTMPLSELGRLGGGIDTRLIMAGIHTVGDLVQCSSVELQRRCNLQPAQLDDLSRRLRAMGLRFGMPAVDAPHQNS